MSKTPSIRICVDAVVFGYEPGAGISLALIRRKYEPFKDSWALPGGFVLAEESLETAVERELMEEAGITVNYLEQLYTFGQPDRDPRGRIISVAYYGLVEQSQFRLLASSDAQDARWFSVNDLPPLAFDHKDISSMSLLW